MNKEKLINDIYDNFKNYSDFKLSKSELQNLNIKELKELITEIKNEKNKACEKIKNNPTNKKINTSLHINSVDDLNKITSGLKKIDISGSFLPIKIDNIKLPESLHDLTLINCKILKEIKLPKNLNFLVCEYTNFIYCKLKLPQNLIKLSLIRCKIQKNFELSKNLTELICEGCEITSLSNIPDTLNYINVFNNNIKEFTQFPINLKKLDIGQNSKLIKIKNINENLEMLQCDYTNIKKLKIPLNSKLKFLNINNSKITKIDYLPETLQEFHCENTELIYLPNIPINIEKLLLNDKIHINELQYNILIDLNNLRQIKVQNHNFNFRNDCLNFLLNNEPIIPLTENELEAKGQEANIKLTNINAENKINAEKLLENTIIQENEIQLNIPKVSNDIQTKYKRICNNKEDLIGDDLNVKYGNLVIIDISNDNKYVVWCFTYPEALEMWQYSKTYNILPNTGQSINKRGVLLSRLYNTFVLRKTDNKTINYVGHHDIKTVYTLDPISKEVFLNEIRITPEIINNFVPTINDLNLYYLNNPYIENNNTIKIINENNYIGELGSIIIDDTGVLTQTVKIIKDNEVDDINKTYTIIKDSIL
jgi:hypothetical protein